MNEPMLRTPPHSLEAERSVLGSILIDPKSLYLAELAPEEFFNSNHRTIFKAMVDADQQGNPPDIVIVSGQLDSIGQLEDVGGMSYLVKLTDDTPSALNIASYAKVVKERALLRSYIQAARELSSAAFDGDTDALGKFMAKTVSHNHGRQKSMKQALTEAVEFIDKAHREGPQGVPTGITKYDQKMGGLHDQDLVIVGGRPSMGKTSLMCNITTAAVNTDRSVGIISLEMSQMQLIHRFFSLTGRLSMQRMRSGQMEDADWPRLSSAVSWMQEKPIHIHEGAAMSIAEVTQVATAMKHRDGIDVLMVDYLQLINGEGENRTGQVGHVSRSLKALAKRLDIPVVAMGQVNRDVEKRQNKRPLMADLRDSGEIEQDADVIVMLYREGYYNDEVDDDTLDLGVEKNRNGPVGIVPTGWDPDMMMIQDQAPAVYSVYEQQQGAIA